LRIKLFYESRQVRASDFGRQGYNHNDILNYCSSSGIRRPHKSEK